MEQVVYPTIINTKNNIIFWNSSTVYRHKDFDFAYEQVVIESAGKLCLNLETAEVL